MSKRRVVLYVIALATTVTLVLALLNRSQLAIAALAIALVAMFGWVVLWARALNARVGQIGADIERQGRRNLRPVADLGNTIGSLDERLSSTQQYVARRAESPCSFGAGHAVDIDTLQQCGGRIVDQAEGRAGIQYPARFQIDWLRRVATICIKTGRWQQLFQRFIRQRDVASPQAQVFSGDCLQGVHREVCRDPHGTSLQRVAVDHTPQPCKVINNLSDWFVAGTIVVFDEYFGYHGWQRHEHKAFQEFL
jgi:hypothetical protein